MRQLKTATGTEDGFPRIGILMEPSSVERYNVEAILKKRKFEVYCFDDQIPYHEFRRESPLDITFLLGRSSGEVGKVIGLIPFYKGQGDFCIIGSTEVADMLGLNDFVYVLPTDFSEKDLVNKVHEIMNK